jgi:hypothetical protein
MEQKGFDFAAIPQTAIRIITQPAAFFREMPKTGGFVEPLIFMVVIGVVSGIIQAVLGLLHLNMVSGAMAGITAIIMMPVAILIGGFIGAAIAFVVWKLMGSVENYETAYRCCAYASAISPVTTLLGIIPYLGSIIGILIGTYYIVMASVEVHRIPAKKAWTVFGIIAAVLILLSLSGQFAARKIAGDAERFKKEMEEASREIQKSADQSRKAAEEMGGASQKQTEEMQKEAQKEMQEQTEEMKRANEEMKKQLEEMQKKENR